MGKKHIVAAYYFPGYHADPENDRYHGSGWTEWDLVQAARPRFPGHQQPKVPAWGYEDESDPVAMAKKISAAATSGVDAFLFDWYWHERGIFLERGLERGFLAAENSLDLKFALMWANHDWINIHPARRCCDPELRYGGVISPSAFVSATDYMIENYFGRENYLRMEGALYLSIYELSKLIGNFGSVADAARALQDLRKRVQAAGLGEIHLNSVIFGETILPGEQKVESLPELLAELGFDSVTSYVWIHHETLPGFPFTPYSEVCKGVPARWHGYVDEFDVPYYPNVTMGWDASPRTVQDESYEQAGYPFTPMLSHNTPAEFGAALRCAKEFLDQAHPHGGMLTINAWNEWTEGSYLEPDTVHGMAYLDAVRDVFGK